MFSKLNSKIDFSMDNISKDIYPHRYSLGIYVNRNGFSFGGSGNPQALRKTI